MSDNNEFISLEEWLASRPDKPDYRKIPLETPEDRKRFDSYCKRLKNGCLIHDGFEYGKGYAGFVLWGNAKAHRVSYAWAYGEPKGDVHHTCENKRCVEPTHLKDTADGVVYPRHRGATPETHCVHGHEFTPENTYKHEKTGNRACKTCKAQRAAVTYAALTDEGRDELNARRRQNRKHVVHEPRSCEVCGAEFTPKRVGSGRGRLCPEPPKTDMVAHAKWRECVNTRQRLNREGRLGR